jgi:hypothetical protein
VGGDKPEGAAGQHGGLLGCGESAGVSQHGRPPAQPA